jgi:hypothetical protein
MRRLHDDFRTGAIDLVGLAQIGVIKDSERRPSSNRDDIVPVPSIRAATTVLPNNPIRPYSATGTS